MLACVWLSGIVNGAERVDMEVQASRLAVRGSFPQTLGA